MKRIGIASALLVLSGMSMLVGCGAASDGADGASALGRVVPEAAGKNCPAGGQAFEFGVDANGSGALDADEIKGTSYVCNGSSANADVKPVTAGDPRCPNGGSAFTLTGNQEVVVCNGTDGSAGARGAQGDAGAQGAQGAQGDAGAAPPELVLGQFLVSQVVKGVVLTCSSVSSTATTASCTGMKIDGLEVRLAPAEANAVCGAITGKSYNTANGLATVASPYFVWNGTAWALNNAGSTSPMQNLTCNR